MTHLGSAGAQYVRPIASAIAASPSLRNRDYTPRWTIVVGRALLGTLLVSNVLWAHAQTQSPLPPIQPRIPIADPNAPLTFRPSVSTLGSGAALVNITAPNAAGMSLNQYQRFDAPAAGVVLNNSQAGGTALLGSGVSANGLTINPAGDFINESTVQVNGGIAISARNIQSNLTTVGGIASTGKLDLAATQKIELGAQGVVTSKADTTMAAAQGLTNAGSLNSGAALTYSGTRWNVCALSTRWTSQQ
ncbi:MAG TPA: hypothetical protein VLJ57_06855 [Burkholderiaceae bacterium]|nr:hypothetical protein [Burkholderiaceae bacterium]